MRLQRIRDFEAAAAASAVATDMHMQGKESARIRGLVADRLQYAQALAQRFAVDERRGSS